jgi:quercetin dioxygenase-like cupin family protein
MMEDQPQAFAVDLNDRPDEGEGDESSGKLTWKTLISSDRTPSAEVIFGVATFPPGGHLKLHRHQQAEFYFGLEGEGVVTIEGKNFRIAEGISIFIPGSAEHGVLAGEQGLRIAYGFAGDSYADIVYEMS